MAAWVKGLDAVSQIGAPFDEPVEKHHANVQVSKDFTALREPPPVSSGLNGAALDIGLSPPVLEVLENPRAKH